MGKPNRANLKSVEGDQSEQPDPIKPIPFDLPERLMAAKLIELYNSNQAMIEEVSRYLEKAHGLPEGAIGPTGQYSISTDGLMPQQPSKIE